MSCSDLFLAQAGAVDSCTQDAIDRIEKAWAKLDVVLLDSFPKLLMRCFGWYITKSANHRRQVESPVVRRRIAQQVDSESWG